MEVKRSQAFHGEKEDFYKGEKRNLLPERLHINKNGGRVTKNPPLPKRSHFGCKRSRRQLDTKEKTQTFFGGGKGTPEINRKRSLLNWKGAWHFLLRNLAVSPWSWSR